MTADDTIGAGGVEEVVRTEDINKVRKPGKYKVILLNDDFTTMEFVVGILEGVFRKPPAEAVQIMLRVHNEGRGLCGIYIKQVAEAKINEVHSRARASGFPLRCILERE
jgi:ATP-dependent Clp protease adaptor protein ClpS